MLTVEARRRVLFGGRKARVLWLLEKRRVRELVGVDRWALLLVWMWRRRGLQRSAWRQRLRQWLMGGISGGGALLLSMA